VIFNGHAGNAPILELLTRRIRRERGLLIPSVSPLQVIQNPDFVKQVYGDSIQLGHGGEPMGSLMMVLQPGKVKMERVGAFGRKQVLGMPTDGLGGLIFRGVRVAVPLDMRDVTPETGSLSDPSGAREVRGRAMLDYAVRFCVEFMQWFRTVDPWMPVG